MLGERRRGAKRCNIEGCSRFQLAGLGRCHDVAEDANGQAIRTSHDEEAKAKVRRHDEEVKAGTGTPTLPDGESGQIRKGSGKRQDVQGNRHASSGADAALLAGRPSAASAHPPGNATTAIAKAHPPAVDIPNSATRQSPRARRSTDAASHASAIVPARRESTRVLPGIRG